MKGMKIIIMVYLIMVIVSVCIMFSGEFVFGLIVFFVSSIISYYCDKEKEQEEYIKETERIKRLSDEEKQKYFAMK